LKILFAKCPVFCKINWTFYCLYIENKNMKITEYIAFTIDRFPKGYIFTYNDFIDEVNKKEAIIKALNRMATSGKIAQISKGKYLKVPIEKITDFDLEENEWRVVELESDPKEIEI